MIESQLNTRVLKRLIEPEFNYLKRLVQYRLERNFDSKEEISLPDFPAVETWSLKVPENILRAPLTELELILLILAICPHIHGNLLDEVIHKKLQSQGDFPQLGGVRGKNYRGFLPTAQTALFLLTNDDVSEKRKIMRLFDTDHFFGKNRILWLEETPEGEPRMSGKIIMNQEYVDQFLHGKVRKPQFSMKFPAQIITTEMSWDDLVLNSETQKQIEELQTWVTHGNTLLNEWGMSKKLKPGYRVLLYGNPGTGKTLTASLLGKYTGRDVYKIDLSMVVSKFIGETEKNLANLLSKCEQGEDILFFDEADALFGKRTNVRDAHDKYANQEVSYLLQRIETYKGLVLLASNLKNNIDEAFVRRFQSIIHFPMPKAAERKLLWEKAFPAKIKRHQDIDIHSLAVKFELSGAEIMNIMQYACLRTLEAGTKIIRNEYILEGIQREFQKGGRIMR